MARAAAPAAVLFKKLRLVRAEDDGLFLEFIFCEPVLDVYKASTYFYIPRKDLGKKKDLKDERLTLNVQHRILNRKKLIEKFRSVQGLIV